MKSTENDLKHVLKKYGWPMVCYRPDGYCYVAAQGVWGGGHSLVDALHDLKVNQTARELVKK